MIQGKICFIYRIRYLAEGQEMEDIINDDRDFDNDFEDSHLIDDDIIDSDEESEFDDLDLDEDDFSDLDEDED